MQRRQRLQQQGSCTAQVTLRPWAQNPVRDPCTYGGWCPGLAALPQRPQVCARQQPPLHLLHQRAPRLIVAGRRGSPPGVCIATLALGST